MDKCVLIAAVGKNRELGYDGHLIWRFHQDMVFFREHTINKVIVMGRKTFDSLPKLLSNRDHVVLTRQDIVIPGVIVIHKKEDLDLYLDDINYHDDVMIIGGEAIYNLFLNDADQMLLTEINDVYSNADAFFPEFNKDEWEKNVLGSSCENDIEFSHVCYTKKKSRRLL